MKKIYSLSCAALLALTACVSIKIGAHPAEHPFTGCWQSGDGQAREVWTRDPSGWLFGYAANRGDDGDVTFFEHMRIETRGDKEVLIVMGPNDTPTEFIRQLTGAADEYQYVNPAHDYPQVITYKPSPGRLDAVISKTGGANPREFLKRACDGL